MQIFFHINHEKNLGSNWILKMEFPAETTHRFTLFIVHHCKGRSQQFLYILFPFISPSLSYDRRRSQMSCHKRTRKWCWQFPLAVGTNNLRIGMEITLKWSSALNNLFFLGKALAQTESMSVGIFAFAQLSSLIWISIETARLASWTIWILLHTAAIWSLFIIQDVKTKTSDLSSVCLLHQRVQFKECCNRTGLTLLQT